MKKVPFLDAILATVVILIIMSPSVVTSTVFAISAYNSGRNHGCSDARDADQYINTPGKGPAFHTADFNRGYRDGHAACSGGSGGNNPNIHRASSSGGFRVIEATLHTSGPYTGACPHTIYFNGRVSVAGDGGGTVRYRFITGNGYEGPVQTLHFNSAGSRDVRDTHTISSSVSGWEAIQILSPTRQQSNQATFSARCT